MTPDSFSDGGETWDRDAAIARGRALIDAGADVLDIGGESTRPGAAPVGPEEEISRVVPVIRALASQAIPISVDTTKAAVAEAAADAGALLVNDISGGVFDPAMFETVARRGLAVVIGHVRGNGIGAVHAGEQAPPTAEEVCAELAARLALLAPTARARAIADPGLGFGKPASLNLELTRRAQWLASALQCPLMLGPSRKRYLAAMVGESRSARDDATIGAALAAVAAGAHFVRVHAVEKLRPALTAFEASLAGGAE